MAIKGLKHSVTKYRFDAAVRVMKEVGSVECEPLVKLPGKGWKWLCNRGVYAALRQSGKNVALNTYRLSPTYHGLRAVKSMHDGASYCENPDSLHSLSVESALAGHNRTITDGNLTVHCDVVVSYGVEQAYFYKVSLYCHTKADASDEVVIDRPIALSLMCGDMPDGVFLDYLRDTHGW